MGGLRCADLVPRQEEVGERAAVLGLPQLLVAVLLRPGLQDARGVRESPVGGAACGHACRRATRTARQHANCLTGVNGFSVHVIALGCERGRRAAATHVEAAR